MGLIERITKYGVAGLFAMTGVLAERVRSAEAVSLEIVKQSNLKREEADRRYDEASAKWEQRFVEQEQRHAEAMAAQEARHAEAMAAQEARHAEAMAGLHADQSRLLNHLAGVTAAEAVADSTAMEDALAKLLQKQMLDPLSAAIQSAQDEDAANFLLRQQEQQEAIQRELSQMSAQATIPMI